MKPSILLDVLTTLWRIIWFMPSLILRVFFWPFKTIARTVFNVIRSIVEDAKPFIEQQAQALWLWADSFDNPILRRELKTPKFEDIAINWLCYVGLQGFVLFILFGIALLKPMTLLFYGGNSEYNRQTALNMLQWRSWGDIVFSVAIAIGLTANLAALLSQTKAFDRERANGGMVFLFLTPLSEGEIIGAHVGAALLPNAWLHSGLYPSIFLAVLLETIAGHFSFLPLLALLTILLHTLLICSSVTSVWAAVRAKKADEGGAWALLFGAVPQGILLIALLFIISQTRGFWALGATAFAITIGSGAIHFFWLDALRSLHRERFGDVSTKGAVAN
jgi:hypothetical protein